MTPSTFKARLLRPGALTVAPIPDAVIKRDGLRPRQRVKGRIDNVPITSTLMSAGTAAESLGGAKFAICVNQELLERLGKKEGDSVEISVEPHTGPIVVPLPPALRKALAAEPQAKAIFDRLAPSHRKAYAQWVGSAKKAETRDRRIRKTLELIRQGKTLR